MTGRTWGRYVALGDSFTEGMSDPDPGAPGSWVGWADRLAERLGEAAERRDADFGYANLAVRGRLLADVVGPQLEAGLALSPDLVSIVGGGNDILRPRADVDALAATLEAAVARIRATGADVLMATPADPWKAPLVRAVRGRMATYVASVWGIAQRQGAFVIDQWSQPFLRDWQMWADDRIHLTPEGHRRIALAAAWTLGLETDETDWRGPVPPARVLRRHEAAAANARWAREYVGPWVRRRLRGQSSGDALTAKRPLVAPLEPRPGPTPPGARGRPGGGSGAAGGDSGSIPSAHLPKSDLGSLQRTTHLTGGPDMGFMDKIKQKADEYDLQGKADRLSEGIEKTSKQAVEKAGALAHDNRDKITSGLDRAGAKFDAQTDGKYTDKVTKAKQMAAKGVEKVAEQRPGSAGAAGAAGATGAATTPPTPGTPYVAPVVPPQDASPFTTPDAGATPPAGPQDPSI